MKMNETLTIQLSEDDLKYLNDQMNAYLVQIR